MSEHPFIEINGVSKSFGNTQALHQVNFKASGGEIHAVLGENGAGKTTLVNVISGVVKPDSGTVKILGDEVQIFNPARMPQKNVATVFQNLSLIPHLTVSENLFLDHNTSKTKYQEEYKKTLGLLKSYEIDDIDPFDFVEDLSLNQKQKI
jgi:ribose transport system ATP-binding protein